MSVKDRWVGPREQVLNIPITCWCYGPSKPSSLPSIVVWLSLLLLWLWVGGKLGGDPQIGQLACWGCTQEPCFSGAVTISNYVSYLRNVAIRGLCEIRMVRDHMRTERGKSVACWSGFPLQGVHRFKSLWLSDRSTACLWQSSHR
jgi:hypothetical protein